MDIVSVSVDAWLERLKTQMLWQDSASCIRGGRGKVGNTSASAPGLSTETSYLHRRRVTNLYVFIE